VTRRPNLGGELDDLKQEEKRVRDELDATKKRLGEKRALPLLENVRVASPCHVSWDGMTGDDRVRFCGQCEKNVYNLSAMTREEGEQLLLEKEGKACLRFYRRADGTVMTTDCPVGARRVRVRRVVLATVGGGLVAAATAAMMVTQGKGRVMQGAVEVMGDPTVVTTPMEMGSTMPTAQHPPALEKPAPKPVQRAH
jgi:hypothetical protein